MSSNFNIVKKPKHEDDIIEDEDEIELEEEKEDKKTSDLARKRMFKMMGIIVGGMVILLIILYVCSLFTSKNYSYQELEKILKDAAVSYFKDNPDSLPSSDGDVVEIDSSNLVVAQKMKDFSEYTTKDGVVCSGTVQVEKSGNDYLYTPYLNCGENYLTEEFYKRITADGNIVTSGYGLYASNGGYAYRGEEVDNYVELDNSLWRIVKVTTNNEIVLISENGIEYSFQPWDDRYNESKRFSSGVNNYGASRIKEYLDKVYKNPSEKNGEDILSDNDKTKIVAYNLCIGKRSTNEEGSSNASECSEVLQDTKLGLLSLSDYMYASVDPNCKTASSKSCQNYNYLANKSEWWLATANKDDNSSAYKVERGGKISSDYCSSYTSIRPVIYLNSKVLYKSGKGTLEKPYKIK